MPMASSDRPPLIPLDHGWLFLAPGLVILCATILIPALKDVDDAKWQRDRVLAIEQHRLKRLQNYIDYLDAVDRGDESVVLSLVATQLNMIPEEALPIEPASEPGRTNASVFPELEPAPLKLLDAPPRSDDSLLTRMATGERSRLWLIVLGAIALLVGLLASPSGRRQPEPVATESEQEDEGEPTGTH